MQNILKSRSGMFVLLQHNSTHLRCIVYRYDICEHIHHFKENVLKNRLEILNIQTSIWDLLTILSLVVSHVKAKHNPSLPLPILVTPFSFSRKVFLTSWIKHHQF